ncbi:MAG TPA: hypothetical protein VKL22_06815 [Actinomycetota bacterium]|nr:hypothetical protein [Actinomycetota bacterium]
MPESRAGRGVFVSLQAPDPDLTPVEGHRATGFLVDRDIVLVPDLDQSLLYEAGTYEVLIVPARSREPRAERIKVAYVEAQGLEDGNGEVAAFFHLSRPSGFFVASPPPFRDGGLAAALQAHDGSLRSALEEAGFAPEPSTDPAEALSDLRNTGPASEVPVVRASFHSSVAVFGISICDICPSLCRG